MTCDHVWRFQQTVFWFGSERPGSSAKDRILGDRYYCEKCLETRIENTRIYGHSFDKPLEGVVHK